MKYFFDRCFSTSTFISFTCLHKELNKTYNITAVKNAQLLS